MTQVITGLAMLALVALLPPAQADEANASGILYRLSQDEVDTVEARLREAIADRDLRLVARIDHAQNARGVGLELPETRTLVFGHPAVGTPMMQCRGSMALDLPQKMLVRATPRGTRLEWNDPHYLARRHGLAGCELPLDRVAAALAGLAEAAAR